MGMDHEIAKYKKLLAETIRIANGRTRLRIAFAEAMNPHGYTWPQVKHVLDQVEVCNFAPFLQTLQDAANKESRHEPHQQPDQPEAERS